MPYLEEIESILALTDEDSYLYILESVLKANRPLLKIKEEKVEAYFSDKCSKASISCRSVQEEFLNKFLTKMRLLSYFLAFCGFIVFFLFNKSRTIEFLNSKETKTETKILRGMGSRKEQIKRK